MAAVGDGVVGEAPGAAFGGGGARAAVPVATAGCPRTLRLLVPAADVCNMGNRVGQGGFVLCYSSFPTLVWLKTKNKQNKIKKILNFFFFFFKGQIHTHKFKK